MATKILAVRRPDKTAPEYYLPPAERLQLLQDSSKRPCAEIPLKRLAIVERLRLNFITRHGSDGCSEYC